MRINLGTKYPKGQNTLTSVDKGPSVSYPSFDVNGIAIPLSPKDVGRTIKVVCELKVNKAGAEIDQYGDGKKKHRSSFSVISMSLPGKSKIKIDHNTDKSDLDDMERQEFDALSIFAKKGGK